MTIRIRSTGALVNDAEFRALHPNTSIPAVIAAEIFDLLGADPVLEAPAPTTTTYQSVTRNGAVLDGLGNWVTAWTVTNWTQEQIDAHKAQGRIDRWEDIKAERDRRKAAGYTVGGKWYHSDDGSRIQQLGLVMMGANVPAGLQWKTMDGTFVTMTQTLAAQIFQAATASDMAIFAKAEWHKSTMEASATPNTYAYLQGWPLIFGE